MNSAISVLTPALWMQPHIISMPLVADASILWSAAGAAPEVAAALVC